MVEVEIANRLPRPTRIGNPEIGVGLQEDGFIRIPEVSYLCLSGSREQS